MCGFIGAAINASLARLVGVFTGSVCVVIDKIAILGLNGKFFKLISSSGNREIWQESVIFKFLSPFISDRLIFGYLDGSSGDNLNDKIFSGSLVREHDHGDVVSFAV